MTPDPKALSHLDRLEADRERQHQRERDRTRHDREVKRMGPVVAQINAEAERLKALSEEELKAQTPKLRGIIAERTGPARAELDSVRAAKHDCADPTERDQLEDRHSELEAAYKKQVAEVLHEILPEAFATVREACRRLVGTTVTVTGRELVWDMVPYDVQLIGGIVLHQGRIAEMATGEGIGLPLVRRMVERHGGKIWVESQENQGATFFVALPTREHSPLTIAPRKESIRLFSRPA